MVQILFFFFAFFTFFEWESLYQIPWLLLNLISGIILTYYSFKKDQQEKLSVPASFIILFSYVLLIGGYLFAYLGEGNDGPGFGNIVPFIFLWFLAFLLSCIGSIGVIMKIIFK